MNLEAHNHRICFKKHTRNHLASHAIMQNQHNPTKRQILNNTLTYRKRNFLDLFTYNTGSASRHTAGVHLIHVGTMDIDVRVWSQ